LDDQLDADAEQRESAMIGRRPNRSATIPITAAARNCGTAQLTSSRLLGIERGRRDTIAVAVSAEIDEDAAVLANLARNQPPDSAMAAVHV